MFFKKKKPVIQEEKYINELIVYIKSTHLVKYNVDSEKNDKKILPWKDFYK